MICVYNLVEEGKIQKQPFRKKPLFIRENFALLPNCERYTYNNSSVAFLEGQGLLTEILPSNRIYEEPINILPKFFETA